MSTVKFSIPLNTESCVCCRIQKAPKGSAVFEEVSKEQHTGTVVDRVVPPTRGYNPAGESGLVAYETADSMKQQLPFGLADLQVRPGMQASSFCMPILLCTSTQH